MAGMGSDQPHPADRVRRARTRSPIAKDKRGDAPFSVDANLLHSSSSEGKILEDPAQEADEIVYQRTIRPEDAPDHPTVVISMDFQQGDAVAIDDVQGAVAGGNPDPA